MLRNVKGIVKERICEALKVPYNRYGIPLTLKKYFPEGQAITLVDVGAYNGDFTGLLASYCGISKGLLIEPLPQRANRLRQLFSPPIYQVFECALSSENGIVEFEINEAEVTSSILKIYRQAPELSKVPLGVSKTIFCKTSTLNKIVYESDVEQIDLLKIDVQGAEKLVLSGADQVLDLISMIWIEVSFKPLYEGSCIFSDIYSLMESSGFKLVEIEPGFRSPQGELLQGDALFKRV